MYTRLSVIFFILANVTVGCNAYKLLLVFPIPGKSHAILGEGYVRHLLDAGHEVTYITPLPLKDPHPRLQQVDVSQNLKYLPLDALDVSKFLANEVDSSDFVQFFGFIHNTLVGTFKTDEFRKFINDPNQHFDAVIVEWLYDDLGAGIASVFGCPLIWSSSLVPHTHILALVDEHLNPSYSVFFMAKEISFNFWDRVRHLWATLKIRLFKWWQSGEQNEEFKEAFSQALTMRGLAVPHFDEVRYNGSLVLGNSHVVFGDGYSLPEKYKHIGGYHIKDTVIPLPEDLQKIMDDSKDGVIYFSLGSMLKSSQIPEDITRRLLNMFGGLKQTIIWKLEKVMPNIPKNVHVVTWAPQESILAHPNCVLFITHGGLLSAIEALNIGVPIIGMPFYADQFLNIERAEAKGYGKRIDLNEKTPERLNDAIREMVENPSYRQRAKEYSAIFKNHIIPPGKELVYWIEYVIQTNGANHLNSPALHVSWYKKLYLDLFLVLILIIGAIHRIFKFLLEALRIETGLHKKKMT